ncbi:MAG: hypothetical protein KAU28_02545 [Phycisphaerae bacterium]|nr:hypothetical protein [Phycisphaerae bacterium]
MVDTLKKVKSGDAPSIPLATFDTFGDAAGRIGAAALPPRRYLRLQPLFWLPLRTSPPNPSCMWRDRFIRFPYENNNQFLVEEADDFS